MKTYLSNLHGCLKTSQVKAAHIKHPSGRMALFTVKLIYLVKIIANFGLISVCL